MRIRVPSPGSAGESALGATGGGAGGERVGAGTQGGGSRHTGWRGQPLSRPSLVVPPALRGLVHPHKKRKKPPTSKKAKVCPLGPC